MRFTPLTPCPSPILLGTAGGRGEPLTLPASGTKRFKPDAVVDRVLPCGVGFARSDQRRIRPFQSRFDRTPGPAQSPGSTAAVIGGRKRSAGPWRPCSATTGRRRSRRPAWRFRAEKCPNTGSRRQCSSGTPMALSFCGLWLETRAKSGPEPLYKSCSLCQETAFLMLAMAAFMRSARVLPRRSSAFLPNSPRLNRRDSLRFRGIVPVQLRGQQGGVGIEQVSRSGDMDDGPPVSLARLAKRRKPGVRGSPRGEPACHDAVPERLRSPGPFDER